MWALHMQSPSAEAWARALGAAGFDIVEQGTAPATLYFLARKPQQAAGATVPTPYSDTQR
jgi:hypothetical protein